MASVSDTNVPRLRVISRPARPRAISLHWLFRSNIPRRRQSFLPYDVHKRNFFGMGEIIGVLTNPAETVRSLTESRRLLEEARQEIKESNERAQIRPRHTFSRFPDFFPRPAEAQALEHILTGEPSFTVVFGATATGKTALLREVLSRDPYQVLHFDLRIAGFADLASLYVSLSQQMELYFEDIASKLPGYGEFQKEAWSFKHDRLSVQNRVSDESKGTGKVKPSDLARLMEMFQSSLLRYSEFDPDDDETSRRQSTRRQGSDSNSSDRTPVYSGSPTASSQRKASWWRGRVKSNGQENEAEATSEQSRENKRREKPIKKLPVLFFDEAHKLPSLIQSMEAMKCLLDSMLVLTKQDRLCHVIHATSDSFYQTWLRQLNIMQHCKIVTIGDCSKSETKAFFQERIIPRIPDRLRSRLDFETLYDAFGGRLFHWHDFISDFLNANGQLDVKQSSHFLQAHALLNLHIIHSSQSSSPAPQPEQIATRRPTSGNLDDPVHPNLGPAGFRIYSPVPPSAGPGSSFAALSGASDDRTMAMVAGYYAADFTAMQLLKVMSRLTQGDQDYLPYFLLCRELGVRAVDGMVKGKVLELRWTEPVTKEGGEDEEHRESVAERHVRPISTAVIETMTNEDGDMMPVTPADDAPQTLADETAPEYSETDVIGPKLLATTPVMRYAMREVVREYEDEQSVSEYASLTDVDEY